MRVLGTIKSTKFEAGIQYLNVYFYFHKTRVALAIKFNKKIVTVQQFATHLNLKRNRPPHWSINKLITANDRIGDTCCRIETITGHQFSHSIHTVFARRCRTRISKGGFGTLKYG